MNFTQSGSLTREQKIREQLFSVLTEFPLLYQARQGLGSKILNPFASLEQAVREHVNPLILYINDLLQEIRAGLPYLEALERVVRFAIAYPYRDRIHEAVRQLSNIEGKRPYFLWGLACLLQGPDQSTRARRLREAHRKLHLWNQYYKKRFGTAAGPDLLPWRATFRDQVDGITIGTYEYPTRQQLEIFRLALAALNRIVREHRLDRWLHRGSYRKIHMNIVELARLLLDYGFTVGEILGRVREEEASPVHFLNDLILSEMEQRLHSEMDLLAASRHVVLMTLLDYRSMIPFRTFYAPLSRVQEALSKAREIERQQKLRESPFRRVIQLYQHYQKAAPPLLAFYLDFQFCRAHGDYLPSRDGEHFGVEITRKFVLRYYDKKVVQQRAEESARRSYSSKPSTEMLELMRLLIRALSSPERIPGKRVHILGRIDSRTMGHVLIGILQGNIVALKERIAPKDARMPLGEQARCLEYEAGLHAHVQSGPSQHENIVESFGIVEEEGHRFLAVGYHPAETLRSLCRKARLFSLNPSLFPGPPLEVRDIKTISMQLLRALIHLKSKQVVHRDLKPSNILYLVDIEGRISLIKIIDFGVALGLGPGLPRDLHGRRVVGTLAYMPPEMASRQASCAADLYSAGVTIYQLMSGTLPVRVSKAETSTRLKAELKRVVQAPRLPLLQSNPSLAGTPALRILAEWVDRMIHRDPGQRPSLETLQEAWSALWHETPDTTLSQPIRYSSP